MKRLDHDATTLEQVRQYYYARAQQALYDGIAWNKDIEPLKGWGYRTTFVAEGKTYESVFVLDGYRGRGYAKEYWQKSTLPCITSPSCKIEGFLNSIGKEYLLMSRHTALSAYEAIQAWYGDKQAERSRVYYMNHIDEGLGILKIIGADLAAAMAFCLHPIVQMDADISDSVKKSILPPTPPNWLILAMEYRAVANAYLSQRKISSVDEIQLSVLPQVNEMLVADKIQNYKDFRLYHKGIHSRSDELDEYFHNWFQRLGLSDNRVEEIIQLITI